MADSKWSPQQKIQIVLAGLQGETAADRKRQYGLSEEEYQTWVTIFIENGKHALHQEPLFQPPQTTDLFRLLIDSIPHAVFCKDVDGVFTFGNTAFYQAVKTNPEDLLGKNDFEIHSREAAEKFRADDLRVMQEETILHTQERNELVDGTVRWTEVIKVPLKNEHDDIMGIMGMFWDITDQKDIEYSLRDAQETLEFMVEKRTAELLEANERLQAGSRLKTEFISSVSHELRTPLTSVLGFAKLIAKGANILQSATLAGKKHLDRIAQNAAIIGEEGGRLKRLIDDLLDMNKIESGQMTWNDHPVDLGQIARDSVNIMQGQFAAKPQVVLEISTPDEPAMVNADPDRPKQVFINLLNNAGKFTQKGEVRVTIEVMPNQWVQTEISDTGHGISKEDIALIFEDYYQGLQTMISDKGTGLGLSICKQVISHYRGKFWAKSEEGQGATFYFRLPMHTE